VGRRGLPPRTVLISTGATDLDGIGRRVSNELLELDPTLDVFRVVGPDSHGSIDDPDPRERRLVAPGDLAQALTVATVYVGAAGTTAVQAACVGIPGVIAAAVPNQHAQAAALAAAGCALMVDVTGLATTCLELLDDSARCESMGARGRTLVDGRGAPRVAEAVRTLAGARVTR
jgi:UDP-2,4-diacetamido-2,4,6-trideoxy-beta-L-altropyranose hydrolase